MTRASNDMLLPLVFITMALCFLANIACAVYLPETYPGFRGWNIPFVAGWLGVPGIGYIICRYVCEEYENRYEEPPVVPVGLGIGFGLYLSIGWIWSSLITRVTW